MRFGLGYLGLIGGTKKAIPQGPTIWRASGVATTSFLGLGTAQMTLTAAGVGTASFVGGGIGAGTLSAAGAASSSLIGSPGSTVFLAMDMGDFRNTYILTL